MAHEVEGKIAYAGQPPWHGLGVEVSGLETPEEMLEVAGLDWTVSKRPTFFASPSGTQVRAEGQFALARDGDDHFLSMVGDAYKPIQNIEAFRFFDRFVRAGQMTMETAGSLRGGQFVFGLAKLPMAGIELFTGDRVDGYLLISKPHVVGKAMTILFTTVRVVCMNTLTYALGKDLQGKEGSFRLPHVTAFDADVKRAAEIALGLSEGLMTRTRRVIELLSSAPVTDEDELMDYLAESLAVSARSEREPNESRESLVHNDTSRPPSGSSTSKRSKTLDLAYHSYKLGPGSALTSARGTWWGALNAVTNVIDHQIGVQRSVAVHEALLGHRSGMKRKAVELALEFAGVPNSEIDKVLY